MDNWQMLEFVKKKITKDIKAISVAVIHMFQKSKFSR